MKDFPKKQLVIHYLLGICTPREEKEVENWLEQDVRNVHRMQEVVKHLDEEPPLSTEDKQEIKTDIFNDIESNSDLNTERTETFKSGKHKDKGRGTSYTNMSLPWLKVAAIILVLCTAAIGGYYYYVHNKPEQKVVWQKRIIPYGQNATLRFSDGTVIKLNGGSTLRYPTKFTAPVREVYLKGEAFFSVAEKKSKPFVVHAGDITARVLGTAFNIEAYGKENDIQVAVKEGKVAVSKNKPDTHKKDNNEPFILTENQWATYYKQSALMETGEGNIWKMIAWKDDVLIFNNKPLGEVARMLERWYGVTVEIKDEALKDVVLAGEHEDVSLSEVLESIQFILGVKYKIRGDSVTIQKPQNNNQLNTAN